MVKEAENLKTVKDAKLRVWPGLAASALIVIGFSLGFSLNLAMPDVAAVGNLVALVAALAVFVWWLFFSRVRWAGRLGAMALLIAAWFAMRPFLDKSIIGGGMGALPIFALPVFAVALSVWAWATRDLSGGIRRVSIVAAMVIAGGLCTLVKTAGLRGGGFEFHWRWTPSHEERLVAQGNDDPAPIPPAAAPATTELLKEPPAAAKGNPDQVAIPPLPPAPGKPAEWPGFRGAHRDGVVRNLRIETDWSKSPPVELWRRPIGPGWSSFAVDGDLIYTQEQRGDDEIVACYRLSTGEPVWRHRDAVRFWESNGGAGPRGTPTLLNGRVYAFGATGIVNVLDGGTGAVIWSRNAAADSKVEVPDWGFSSSPLVIDDLVVVAAAAKPVAYDIATGKPRWIGPPGGFSYSSPHLISIDGVPQIVLLGSGKGAASYSPSDGAMLWRNEWSGGAIVQPAVTADGDVLINNIALTGGQGIRRLAIARKAGEWTVEERWTSTGLKPYFNDFVVHNGHAFGFDGSILSSIDLADGKRKWKGGRYGSGQLMLLAEQGLLLVLSDEGELALVSATPDEFKELARFKAIEGKTWNHPVVVHDILLVRNGEEMAAFRLHPEAYPVVGRE
jgi:outer membrane protein assembly factor BamB